MATAIVPRETKASPPASATIITALVESIDVGDNVRTDVGVLQPIRIRPNGSDGRFVLVYGQRRLLAAREAGLTHITAVVDHASADGVGRPVTQLVENLQRRDLNPLEEARALRAILDADPQLTQAELAKRIGRSAPYVSNALRILELDAKVLPLVESGKLSGAHAKALASLKGKVQRDYAETALRTDASAHELERMVTDYHERQKRAADEVRALEGWAAVTEQQLLEQGAAKTASTLTTLDGYSWSGEKELAALKARGWKVKAESWSRGKQCDCSAFGVGRTWDKATRIVKRCVVHAHYKAKLEAEGRRESIGWEERNRQDALRRARRDALQAAVADQFTEAFRALPPNVARILLWAVMDYSINDWVRDRKGDRKKPDAWGALSDQDSATLADELVTFVFRDFGDRYNVKLDLEAIAEAFGVELPAEKPTKVGKS